MKRLSATLTLFLVGIILITIWIYHGLAAVNTHDKTQKIFIVKNKENIRDIAYNLKREGLLRDPIFFFLLVKKMGLDGKIQAGDFRLSPSMTAEQIATTLTHGTLDMWVTIPEGLRAQEIAHILQEKIPTFAPSWKQELEKNEGYLFPDTYLIPRDADISLIVSLLKNTFALKYTSIEKSKTTKLSDSDTVVVASIIEREAIFNDDRPLVASVIMNRLAIGMPLQIDPTVQYAIGYQQDTKHWWKEELTLDDLKTNSPFNTYKNTGLPPHAISNPGTSALQAALTPAQTNYLYYYSDQQGHLHFSKTYDGHNDNITKYGK